MTYSHKREKVRLMHAWYAWSTCYGRQQSAECYAIITAYRTHVTCHTSHMNERNNRTAMTKWVQYWVTNLTCSARQTKDDEKNPTRIHSNRQWKHPLVAPPGATNLWQGLLICGGAAEARRRAVILGNPMILHNI